MSAEFDDQRFRTLLRDFPGLAIKILYDRYYFQLLRFSIYYTRHRQTSEEIVQDAFASIYQRHQRIAKAHDKLLKNYLIRIVRNKSIDHFRKVQSPSAIKAVSGDHELLQLAVPSHETDLVKRELSHEIRQIIFSFPRRERECILLQLDEELRSDEIAERLGVSRKAVNRSLASAKNRLKAHFEALNQKTFHST